jgi:hypothetical protein
MCSTPKEIKDIEDQAKEFLGDDVVKAGAAVGAGGANVAQGAAAGQAAVEAVVPKIPDMPAPSTETGSPTAAVNTAKADQDAAKSKLQRRRRVRAASLLATGGQGDATSPVTGRPAASAKQQLGA